MGASVARTVNKMLYFH